MRTQRLLLPTVLVGVATTLCAAFSPRITTTSSSSSSRSINRVSYDSLYYRIPSRLPVQQQQQQPTSTLFLSSIDKEWETSLEQQQQQQTNRPNDTLIELPLIADATTTTTGAAAAASATTTSSSSSSSGTATTTTSSSSLELTAALQQRQEVTDRINTAALTNFAVVGLCVFSAVYELFHEKIAALAALYEYGLGPHGPDVTLLAVSADLLARMPMDALHAYEMLVPTNPIFFKACTSGVAYALGDALAQLYQGRTVGTMDLPRSFRSGAAGFLAHGPLCHYWLLFMETYLDFDGAWWATGIKVTADLTVWSIFLNMAYSTIIGLLAARSPQEVFRDVRATTWPALRSAWRFWPFVHTVSFSHAVPLDLKLLWVDVMEVVWVTILSKVANEDKNKKLAEEESAAATVTELVTVVESHNVEPGLEIELTRQEELSNTPTEQLAFELPQKVIGACWPLIAMWPVLYVGYQIETALGLVQPHV